MPNDKLPPKPNHQTTCAHQSDGFVQAETGRRVGKANLKSDRLLVRCTMYGKTVRFLGFLKNLGRVTTRIGIGPVEIEIGYGGSPGEILKFHGYLNHKRKPPSDEVRILGENWVRSAVSEGYHVKCNRLHHLSPSRFTVDHARIQPRRATIAG